MNQLSCTEMYPLHYHISIKPIGRKQTFCECISGSSIVRREEDKRVTVDLEFTQLFKNFSHTSIQLHHRITVPVMITMSPYHYIIWAIASLLVIA